MINLAKNYILVGKEHRVKEVEIRKWSEWFGKADKERRVGNDMIGKVRISTVFVGVGLLFETMIFEGSRNGEQFRYNTWKQALKGHKKIVNEIKKFEPLHQLRK